VDHQRLRKLVLQDPRFEEVIVFFKNDVNDMLEQAFGSRDDNEVRRLLAQIAKVKAYLNYFTMEEDDG
jgi:hypothetical protein